MLTETLKDDFAWDKQYFQCNIGRKLGVRTNLWQPMVDYED